MSQRKYTRQEYNEYVKRINSADDDRLHGAELSFEEWKEHQPEADEIFGIIKKVV